MKLLLLLLALVATSIKAQEQDLSGAQVTYHYANVSGQRIRYVRNIPAAIRKQMPKGAKSCFLGPFRLASNSEKIWLHFYDENSKYMLALFRTINNKRYQFIRRVDANYKKPAYWPPYNFGAQLLWLDPKKKTKPILKLDLMTHSEYGVMGSHLLLIFPQGLDKEVFIQTLSFGRWRASSSMGQTTTFKDVDDRGFLELHTTLHPAAEEFERNWVLRWNGEKFVSITKPVKGGNHHPDEPYP